MKSAPSSFLVALIALLFQVGDGLTQSRPAVEKRCATIGYLAQISSMEHSTAGKEVTDRPVNSRRFREAVTPG